MTSAFHSPPPLRGAQDLTATQIVVSIVERDERLRLDMAAFLGGAGIHVTAFASSQQLDLNSLASSSDVIILDFDPAAGGFAETALLRAHSSVGIIMLHGRVTRSKRLLGLSMGVDHYLPKPVDFDELASVVRNLAWRSRCAENAEASLAQQAKTSTWTLCTNSQELVGYGGRVELSPTEYEILLPLLSEPGTPISRDIINARLGKPELPANNRSLDVLISRLRRKIETGIGWPLPLRSARNSGYVFTGTAQVVERINH